MPHSLIRDRTDKEPIGAHKGKMGRHSEELVGALEQARSRKGSAGDQKLMAPPLELSELSKSLVAKQLNGIALHRLERRGTRAQCRDRDAALRHQQSVCSRSEKDKQHVELLGPHCTHEREGSRSSSTQTTSCQVTQAPVGMVQEHHEKTFRFEAHHDGSKSLVMLNKETVRQDDGVAHQPDTRQCQRLVGALNLQHAKTVVTTAVRESENADREGIREGSWESLWAPGKHGEKASLHKEQDEDKTSL